ncbi:reverse transcriptase domain-containing protein [Tanacetum coccineum]
MAQFLEAPTKGYEDAIVFPEITADNFELKHGLLTLVQNKQFFGHDKEDPHAHIRYINKITSTMKFPNVPSTSVKLIRFPFSLEGAARIWLEKDPLRSILTWDDLVSKFINKFFPPSKTTNLRNEITRFPQRFVETFYEAWDRFNDLLRACPHHGFSELHQLDTFYNALNSNDQDSLDSATGGNFLNKRPRDCLTIIERKSKVHNSRNKPVVAKVSTSNSTPGISLDVAELKDMVKALLLDKKNQSQALATVKAVEENCVTCGDAHSYLNCPATDGNVYRDNIQEYVSQAAAANFNQGNTSYRPSIANQIRPPSFPPIQQNQGNNQNRTLPSNTITNPKEDLKGITTRRGVAYQRPTIPTTSSSPPKVVERETEVTKDTEPPTNNGSTKDIRPPVVQVQPQVPNSEHVIAPVSAPKPNPKPSIPYPSRLNVKKIREKANDQIEKFYEIFKDLNLEISFTDALILMPKFASTLKALIRNKEKLSEMARTPLNEHCSAVILNKLPEKLRDPGKFLILCEFLGMDECLALADLGTSINLMPLSMWKKLSLPELTPTCMTLELADGSISQPIGIAEDVFVKVGKFHFMADFVVVDFDTDPQVPLILRRSFLKTGLALIDVYEGEITLRVGKEAVTFNLDQTSRYSSNYDDNSVNRIDVIDMAYEEYSQEVLTKNDKSSIDEPPEVELKDLPPHLEYAFLEGDDKFSVIAKDLSVKEKAALIKEKSYFMVKECIVLGHKISKNGIEVDKAKVDVIAKLPHPATIKGVRSFLGHTGFHRRFIKDFSKISRPMTHLFKKNTPFIFSDECIQAFETLKKKLTEAPILIAPDWDLPFEFMCDASDFAIGAVLGQRHERYFRPIHYASKTMTEAESHYTTTEKEMLAVVYAYEKFRSYLILNKSIVYTDHSALKYLFAKKDSKARLLWWVLLLQEFKFKIIDTKGAENLAADHLS